MPVPPLWQWVFGIGGSVAGVLALAWWASTLRRALDSRGWPVANGVVEVSELEHDADFDSGEGWRPRVVYRYRAIERDFRGECIVPGAEKMYFFQRRFAQRILDRYPVGKRIAVRYDPLLPDRSLLEPGLRWQTFLPLAFAAIFLFLGGMMLAQ